MAFFGNEARSRGTLEARVDFTIFKRILALGAQFLADARQCEQKDICRRAARNTA